jgi:nucleoside-diphosphate-sugar epimerase
MGATGLVGGYVLEHLVRRGEQPFALSRSPKENSDHVTWLQGDLEKATSLNAPPFDTLYCTASCILLSAALPHLFNPKLTRVVVFSSTSVMTKIDSEVAAERNHLRQVAEAEQRISELCNQNKVAWTILRPTLIYAEGRDTNITPLSNLIRKFGFMPVVGGGPGLRQPVHAEDLAIGAISAAGSSNAANKIYALPGQDTITYREMIGRIIDGLGMPRRIISVSPLVWRGIFSIAGPLFPGANAAMGIRMMKDMAFDSTPAVQDFGWKPREFKPRFD